MDPSNFLQPGPGFASLKSLYVNPYPEKFSEYLLLAVYSLFVSFSLLKLAARRWVSKIGRSG